MVGCICVGAKKSCYALMWSYGEICVGCGCCGKASPKRDRARLKYWQEELKRLENFSYYSDEPKMRAIQAQNIQHDLPPTRRLVRYYQAKVSPTPRQKE